MSDSLSRLYPNERLVFVDIETTGLFPNHNLPLEIGFHIIDLELKTVDCKDWLIWDTPRYDNHFEDFDNIDTSLHPDEQKDLKFIFDMHTSNNLWNDAAQHGCTPSEVNKEVLDWLKGHGISKEDPLCGSSVSFDRSWMDYWFTPCSELFSYRNIDISTLKELCMRFNPRIYEQIKNDTSGSNRKLHRVVPDIEDTISEFKFYLTEFLYH